MNRVKQLIAVSMNLLISSLSGADMGTPELPTVPFMWTAEQHALGNELLTAATIGNLMRIEEIVTQDSSLVNFKNNNGFTILMKYACEGNAALVDKFLRAHAIIDIQDNDGWTALVWATLWGRTEIVNKLIAVRADVNRESKCGTTALMYAATVGCTELVQVLLDARAESRVKNSFGCTALEFAHQRDHTAVIELLQNHIAIEPEDETLMVKPATA